MCVFSGGNVQTPVKHPAWQRQAVAKPRRCSPPAATAPRRAPPGQRSAPAPQQGAGRPAAFDLERGADAMARCFGVLNSSSYGSGATKVVASHSERNVVRSSLCAMLSLHAQVALGLLDWLSAEHSQPDVISSLEEPSHRPVC